VAEPNKGARASRGSNSCWAATYLGGKNEVRGALLRVGRSLTLIPPDLIFLGRLGCVRRVRGTSIADALRELEHHA